MGEITEKERLEAAFGKMREAFSEIKSEEVKIDRHLSLVLTKLEEAMMWLNKNRGAKGYFEKKLDTHVE